MKHTKIIKLFKMTLMNVPLRVEELNKAQIELLQKMNYLKVPILDL